ncbi:hypothetical protein JET14_06220 [Martelella lutilitoris]|uniref:Uncharacterized protein n=1 Tax=Martelella lutilitoris TaxID=2583532 RepID=A0A7T7KNB6_9HYPH|nr:hypothetical protein [Martelella lutilitoris]QQM31759.1 hypothetical protein JET14_06220 [Martelella lutilitoris]
MAEMQKHTIHNERIELLANALDRASTASIAAGLIVPSVSALSHVEALSGLAIISSMVWLFAAFAPHMGARHVLGRLREP